MITFLTQPGQTFTMQMFLDGHGDVLAPVVRVETYRHLIGRRMEPPGPGGDLPSKMRRAWRRATPSFRAVLAGFIVRDSRVVVFTDLERFDPRRSLEVAALHRRLARGHANKVLLNDPVRSLRRFELLRTLNAEGINDFTAHRLTPVVAPTRWPVFIRREDDHGGPLTSLIDGPAALHSAREGLLDQGEPDQNKLVVEFVDARRADGFVPKYAAFRVGRHIIPRHLIFSRDWVAKVTSKQLDEALLAEERGYVAENPHEDELRRIFDLAHIHYGRVDYSVVSGRVQVWEINTNPHVMGRSNFREPHRWWVDRLFARRFIAALRELNGGCGEG